MARPPNTDERSGSEPSQSSDGDGGGGGSAAAFGSGRRTEARSVSGSDTGALEPHAAAAATVWAEPVSASGSVPSSGARRAAPAPSEPAATDQAAPSSPGAEAGGAGADGGSGAPPVGTAWSGSTPPPRRSGAGALILGALIAALIGAGAVYLLDRAGLAPWLTDAEMAQRIDEAAARLDESGMRLGEVDQRLGDLEGRLGELEDAVSAADESAALDELRTGTDARLGEVSERLDQISSTLLGLEDRVVALEERPVPEPGEQQQMLQEEIDAMRAELEQAAEEARTEVEQMRADLAAAAEQAREEAEAAEERAAQLEQEAQAAVRATEAQAALQQIAAAIDNGTAYAGPLEQLRAAYEGEVPGALVEPAEEGVPGLAALSEEFPEAARVALSATATVEGEGNPLERIGRFLRVQTQARSLSPQEGDSPDAILSRAEARLAEDDVQGALEELQALPEDGRAAMSDWIARAETRAEARAAVETLSQDLE